MYEPIFIKTKISRRMIEYLINRKENSSREK